MLQLMPAVLATIHVQCPCNGADRLWNNSVVDTGTPPLKCEQSCTREFLQMVTDRGVAQPNCRGQVTGTCLLVGLLQHEVHQSKSGGVSHRFEPDRKFNGILRRHGSGATQWLALDRGYIDEQRKRPRHAFIMP